VRVRVTEVEAYRHLPPPGDTANHARMGRTARNAPMWGPPGHLYVYLCYGMHAMLNLVCGPEGQAAAVLVRGVEPLEGLARIRERRTRRLHDGTLRPPPEGAALLDGPGKVAAALGLSVAHTGLPIGHADSLQVLAREAAVPLLTGPRVGIDYALPEHVAAPWRVAEAGSRWVGHRRGLRGDPDAP
jgi:DNA-3-methyladenine glycosylase